MQMMKDQGTPVGVFRPDIEQSSPQFEAQIPKGGMDRVSKTDYLGIVFANLGLSLLPARDGAILLFFGSRAPFEQSYAMTLLPLKMDLLGLHRLRESVDRAIQDIDARGRDHVQVLQEASHA